jgi:hypothetical protein
MALVTQGEKHEYKTFGGIEVTSQKVVELPRADGC